MWGELESGVDLSDNSIPATGFDELRISMAGVYGCVLPSCSSESVFGAVAWAIKPAP